MKIKRIPASALAANPWNPNRMSPDRFRKLRREIELNGFSVPLQVRPRGSGFEIVDGEHRFQIAKELGLKSLPCMVTELTDREARLKTLQLNGLRGENDPEKLAALLAELADEAGAEELAQSLPWSATEIEEMVALAEREVEAAVARACAARPEPPALDLYAVVTSPRERETIEAAVSLARAKLGLLEDGAALAGVCELYRRKNS